MAQTFFPIPAVDVTPGVQSSWEDVDCAALIPVGATGVILYITSVGAGSGEDFGLRKKGSIDTDLLKVWCSDFHEWGMIGVDANREFQCYVGNDEISVILIGYTGTGVTFFDNHSLYQDVFTGWSEQDCSADVPANAIGVIFQIFEDEYGRDDGLRPTGSVEARESYSRRTCLGICGCDLQAFDFYAHNVDQKFFLIGYITDGVVFFDDDKDYSLGLIGSWESIDCSGDIVAPASFLFFDVRMTDTAAYNFGLRKEAAGTETLHNGRWRMTCTPCSDAGVCEGQIASLNTNFFLIGYATGAVVEAIVRITAETLGLSEAAIKRARSIRPFSEAVGVAESAIRRLRSIRSLSETVSTIESSIRSAGFIRIITEAIGITDDFIRRSGFVKMITEAISIAETSVRRLWSIRLTTEAIGIIDSTIRRLRSIRPLLLTLQSRSLALTLERRTLRLTLKARSLILTLFRGERGEDE